MKNKNTIEFLGYTFTTREFTGLYLIELYTKHSNLFIEDYPKGTTTREVSEFFMGSEHFNNLVRDGYIEDIDSNDNYQTTSKLEEYIHEFFGCIIEWEALVHKEKKASKHHLKNQQD